MQHKLLILLIFITMWVSRLDAQIAVITHPDVAADSITSAQLRDIYTGDMTFWPDGQPIVVCDLNDEKGVHDQFYNFIAISSSRMKSIWMKRMLSGKSDPPLIFHSGENLSAKIAELPGSIGFVEKQAVTGKVKVLLVLNLDTE
jgi:ABC-type phosphate transport system substrate-binding protein